MIRSALLLIAVLTVAGCTSVRQSFPEQQPGSLWKAMVGVAHAPDYDSGDIAEQWIVRRNEVWVDEPGHRIEVYRELVRDRKLPRKPARREHRVWRFRIQMHSDQAPSATFTARDWAIPSHVQQEAARYFGDVTDVLTAPPPTSRAANATTDAD